MNGAAILLAIELAQLVALAIRGHLEAKNALREWREFAERLDREQRDATPSEVSEFTMKTRKLVKRSRAALEAIREATGEEVSFPPPPLGSTMTADWEDDPAE